MSNLPESFDYAAFDQLCRSLSDNGALKKPAEILGFVTSVCSAPELIRPSEWIPLIWQEDAKDPQFETEQQAVAVFEHLMVWHNYCVSTFTQEARFTLPKQISLNAEMKPTPELENFARGYLTGHEWLKEVWDAYIPDEDSEESVAVGTAMILMMQCMSEKARTSAELPDLINLIEEDETGTFSIEFCLGAVGQLGRAIYEEELESVNIPYYNETKDIGRNDPCPCGSGKKFKKCCLN